MQSAYNKDYTVDVQQQNDLSDKNSDNGSRHPQSNKYGGALKYNRNYRPPRIIRRIGKFRTCCPMHAKYSAMMRRLPHFNPPMNTPCSPPLPRPPYEKPDSLPGDTNTVFNKREITTIPEEVFHYKRQSKGVSAFKKKKAYREKVASLTVVIRRLNEMCLDKPDVLQNKLPEDMMRLFSGIKI